MTYCFHTSKPKTIYSVNDWLDLEPVYEISGQTYYDDAIIPNPETLTVDGKSYPLASKYIPNNDIIVSSAPVLTKIDIKKLDEIRSNMERASDLFESEYALKCIKNIENYLARLFGNNEYERLGLLLAEPNSITNTYDHNKKSYIGIHIDNWDAMPLAKRSLSRIRFLINISSEERYFFMPILI